MAGWGGGEEGHTHTVAREVKHTKPCGTKLLQKWFALWFVTERNSRNHSTSVPACLNMNMNLGMPATRSPSNTTRYMWGTREFMSRAKVLLPTRGAPKVYTI